MHEFVATARTLRRQKRISALDIAKGLLDHGYHAPTIYFPLVVPRGHHDRADRDRVARDPRGVRRRPSGRLIESDAALLQTAPHTQIISRPDEVRAAKELVLRWLPTEERASGPRTADLTGPTEGRQVKLPTV